MMSLPWGASPPRVVPARRAEGLFSDRRGLVPPGLVSPRLSDTSERARYALHGFATGPRPLGYATKAAVHAAAPITPR